ncbi:hypothetical protein HC251_11350 [Iamia sp. SCSIO 61187]|uniref:hypothetical protein n=1 Tax=Iamia sp. SCSIO 61187 TaxID=2722752 RepID=UPI001C627773|nr:hypothetical protein [Iamia sp. SCSIO 61187]QYG92967.1 hypothetical protein HC251_11350 [Iamia sp. SCSIO 61187]
MTNRVTNPVSTYSQEAAVTTPKTTPITFDPSVEVTPATQEWLDLFARWVEQDTDQATRNEEAWALCELQGGTRPGSA